MLWVWPAVKVQRAVHTCCSVFRDLLFCLESECRKPKPKRALLQGCYSLDSAICREVKTAAFVV